MQGGTKEGIVNLINNTGKALGESPEAEDHERLATSLRSRWVSDWLEKRVRAGVCS